MENGTYAAKPTKATVYENEKGSLVVCIGVRLDDGQELRAYNTLASPDGTINQRCLESLKAWSGWDGQDPFWFMDTDLTTIDVEVVVENTPGLKDPSKLWPSVKWINPPGGGAGQQMQEPGERRAILAKFGSKFRALSGGTPARPLAPKPAAPAAPSAPPTRPPTAKPAGSTMDACWQKFSADNAALSNEDREALWFDLVDKVGGGRGQDTFTPADWTEVMIEMDKLPF